jgi:hypothetical protein
MTPRELEEYRALRATIRERGTARVWLMAAGFAAWASLVLATATMMTLPVATLLPLIVLAAVFEGVLALHLGVERIGRYLQVFFEADDDLGKRRWEHTAMAFGKDAAKGTPDPLFSTLFILAALWNFVPAILAGALPIEWAVVGSVHLLFVVRVLSGRKLAGGQRAADLARFQQLKNGA